MLKDIGLFTMVHVVQFVKRPLYMMNPTAPMKVLWDISVLLLVVYSAVAAPFQVAYMTGDTDDRTISEGWKAMDKVIDIIFAVDLVGNFFTGFQQGPREIVYVWRVVAMRYLYFWFWIDGVAIIPFDTFSGGENNQLMGQSHVD